MCSSSVAGGTEPDDQWSPPGAGPPPRRPDAEPPDRTSRPDAELPAVEGRRVEEPPPVVEPVRPASLRERMAKARSALTGAFAGVLGRSAITDDTWDELEEALLRADVGVTVTDALIDDLKTRVKAKEITEPAALLDALQADMAERLAGADRALHFDDGAVPGARTCGCSSASTASARPPRSARSPASRRPLGRSVLMAAGDTFRAAAAEQLGAWADRAGVELVRGDAGGDPSAVIYDGIERAAAKDIDLVLADTAGRLHTKTNLMDELRKVRRVADKGVGRVTETLLVIDATTGQNGLAQAREFGEATQVTGVVLTKLDGSAKGGIVFAIETELGIPIKLVGVGETIGDLVAFEPTEFVAGLFDR